jgi:hypothetical protein
MKPADQIRRLIDKSDVKTRSEADKRILCEALEHLEQLRQKRLSGTRSAICRVITAASVTKLAAAAILLICIGYAAGRLSSPRPRDVQQLQAALEGSLKSSLVPVIRRDLLAEMNREWQLALASNRVQFKAEVKEILVDLIQAMETIEAQDRRWIVQALDQIELNRIRDKTRFSSDLETLAIRTDEKLLRTKRDVAKLLVYSQPDSLVPGEFESLITPNERSKE